ncbi:hypothetical protein PC116_g25354 [Phytophthora cactorum]|uniref:Peptidase S74 domain-containing protein n=2 Tax=Phytophthora cactorum TaxID=29920 RepID=A0A8T0Y0N1_9STRA|nr:hypothetical protein Pcac1_g16087 [Phytophthora cactorum]KAG2794522.1 hypothetical protein PC112_g23011 [Phytophthora cactorum]KAG2818093.1 hypothetical protein PC113_g22898 [Phytophthora cactorum]KAG2872211.1 hypothetical protein PC114_g26506 [Phytophthora cactorum]KAG2963515.1 hypothetical protein PC118_g20845 [Phytophthora cactorum]
MMSDRRLKQDVAPVPIERVRGLYDEIEVKSYRWKSQADKEPELGLIAQDLLDRGFVNLVSQTENNDPELQNSSDAYLEPVDIQLSAQYPKLAVYNMRMIHDMLQRIEKLEKRLNLPPLVSDMS